MSDISSKSGFSGSIGALAGLITAVATLITILYQTGVIGGKDAEPQKTEMYAVPPELDRNAILQRRLDSMESVHAQQKADEMKARIDALEKKLADEARRKAKSSTSTTTTTPVKKAPSYHLAGKCYEQTSVVNYDFNHFVETISIAEYTMFLGIRTVTAEGSGTISGNKIKISYTTIFDTQGTLTLTIINNGNALSGSFYDHSTGGTADLYLVRQ